LDFGVSWTGIVLDTQGHNPLSFIPLKSSFYDPKKIMDIIARVHELIEKGETFCLATVVESTHSDLPAGSKMIAFRDGHSEGAAGSKPAVSALRAAAMHALKENKKGIVEIEDGLRAFLDVLSSEARLIVCGAGHIAVPLVRFAGEVGFQITILDDREDFANAERFPGCDVIAENFTQALRGLRYGPSTYVVIITRGHEHDVDCLTEVLSKENAYVGLIGSRRRVRFVLDWLERKGFAPQRLKEVFTPIGIPIGAESPEEIALAIVSELVCVRRKGSHQARALRAAVGC
jgi:xanthine dehydrogenase accessory factor